MVIGFQEMREEDQPPEDIWLDQEALNDHFQRLKEKYSSNSGGEPMQLVDLDQNEMTRDLKRR